MGCGVSSYTENRVYKYDSIKKQLKTGDLIFFCGSSKFSLAVQIGTFSPWSHVGMVFRDDAHEIVKKPPFPDKDNLYLWHAISDTLTCPDVLTGNRKSGPQLSPLRSLVYHYNGDVAARFIRTKYRITPEVQRSIIPFMRKEAHKCYEQDDMQLYNSICGLGQVEDTSSYFCSELVVETYNLIGYLKVTEKEPSNSYTPNDLSSKGLDEEGVLLTPEYLIKAF